MATDDYTKKQRAFIHDISSPLMIAMGMVESLYNGLHIDSKDDQQLKAEKALKALNRLSELVKEHRNELVKNSKS